MYAVLESDGPVTVCVNLTNPGIDVAIRDETVRVEVANYESSIYIPPGSNIARELVFYRLPEICLVVSCNTDKTLVL